jgi:hypothetical protein
MKYVINKKNSLYQYNLFEGRHWQGTCHTHTLILVIIYLQKDVSFPFILEDYCIKVCISFPFLRHYKSYNLIKLSTARVLVSSKYFKNLTLSAINKVNVHCYFLTLCTPTLKRSTFM